jgi:DNA-binding XRE family transcriptional regulator
LERIGSIIYVTDQQILRLIGRHIRQARLRENMTQECLAELVGIHWKTVGHIERGSYPIALTTFVKLSQFLGTNPTQLFDGIKPPDPKRTAQIKKALARKRAPAKRAVK